MRPCCTVSATATMSSPSWPWGRPAFGSRAHPRIARVPVRIGAPRPSAAGRRRPGRPRRAGMRCRCVGAVSGPGRAWLAARPDRGPLRARVGDRPAARHLAALNRTAPSDPPAAAGFRANQHAARPPPGSGSSDKPMLRLVRLQPVAAAAHLLRGRDGGTCESPLVRNGEQPRILWFRVAEFPSRRGSTTSRRRLEIRFRCVNAPREISDSRPSPSRRRTCATASPARASVRVGDGPGGFAAAR